MNKGFLILEDGRVLSGQTSLSRNVFGQVHLNGNLATLSADTKEHSFTTDLMHKDNNSKLIGKIVIDTLPVEYHMYDVKNAIV